MKKIILLLFCVFVAGCNEHVIVITPVETLRPIEADLGGDYKSIQLKKVVCDFPNGKVLGHVNGQAGSPVFFDPTLESCLEKSIKTHFYSALDNAGYKTIGGTDALFDDYETERADLVAGAKVVDFRQNRKMITQFLDWKLIIEQFIEIEWQIYSRQTKEIIATFHSQGYQTDSIVFVGVIPVTQYIDILVSNAVNNLLADNEFIALFKNKKFEANQNSRIQVIKKIDNYTMPINENSSLVRSAVVTVKSSTGHGSGFVISADGYALTNAHVVGSDSIVKIKLATGKECLADVIYKESERDVALLKLEQDGLVPLPINTGIINVGDEVYAMGSPLEESLSSTLTKGILSAFRTENGLEYIQSDVSIQHGNSGGPLMDKYGNVVGITVSMKAFGSSSNNISVGLNFFIPIKDAIKSVGIELTE